MPKSLKITDLMEEGDDIYNRLSEIKNDSDKFNYSQDALIALSMSMQLLADSLYWMEKVRELTTKE